MNEWVPKNDENSQWICIKSATLILNDELMKVWMDILNEWMTKKNNNGSTTA